MSIIQMSDLNLKKKRILIRSDLNVPINQGKIMSDIRIQASLPTIEAALKQDAYVIIMSHLGRPTEGVYNPKFSLIPIVNSLKKYLNISIRLERTYLDGLNVKKGELVVLENVRFNKGENANDQILSKKYAALCEIFVMDAFGSAHRSQASTHGVSQFSRISCAGLLLSSELQALSKALYKPMRPMVAIIGGSKVSSKLTMLDSLAKIADQLIIGGGITNTFIAAQGYNVGQSLYEPNLIPYAKKLLKSYSIPIPIDVRVATQFCNTSIATIKKCDDIKDNEQILDIGDVSAKHLAIILKNAKTILWNGPIGVFEFPNFRKGTEIVARAVAESKAFSIVGGGDTLSAIDLFGIRDDISYISTGGGAFLSFVEGKSLPVITMLKKRAFEQDIKKKEKL